MLRRELFFFLQPSIEAFITEILSDIWALTTSLFNIDLSKTLLCVFYTFLPFLNVV